MDQLSFTSNLRTFLAAMLVFILLATIGVSLITVVNARKSSEHRMAVATTSAIAANTIERQLTHAVATTYALAIPLRQSNGKIDNFEATAQALMQFYDGISCLQLAPMGVVTKIYPLAGNEAGLGQNQLADPKLRPEALAAIKSRTLTLAGPLDMTQGGSAVVGRLPVFLTQTSGRQRFWGFTIAVIKLDEFFGAVDIKTLLGPEHHYHLSRIDPATGELQTIAQSSEITLVNPVRVDINMPNAKWTLAVAPSSEWGPPLSLKIWAALFIACILIAVMTYIIVKQAKQISAMALHDSLTGLPNRELFNERAKMALAQARRHNHYLAFMFIDINDFKMVNDLMGHEAGDQLLCQLAKRLKTAIRANDTVARIGGDEFLILLTSLEDTRNADIIAQKLKQCVETPFLIQEQELGVSLSIGISFYPTDGDNLDSLRTRADTAMYREKKQHKTYRHTNGAEGT